MSTPGPELRQVIKKTSAPESALQAANLLNEIRQAITDALENKPPVVIVAGADDQKKKSHKWDIAQLFFTALLTFVVGLVGLAAQRKFESKFHNLSDEVTAATQTITQAISTRYALTQEYDKEKFKVYQRAMERLSTLENALRGARYSAASRAKAIDAYNSLDDEINRAEFYFSSDIFTELHKVISLTSSAKVINPQESGQISAVTAQIALVKNKIRDELRSETVPPSTQK